MPNYELDQELDRHAFLKEHPVYCPVPWCSAHKSRFMPCGDVDGEYRGIHIARIEYVKKFFAIEKKRIEFYRDLGLSEPEMTAAWSRIKQDAIDFGMVKGRKGRRKA